MKFDPQEAKEISEAVERWLGQEAGALQAGKLPAGYVNIQVSVDGGKTMIDLGDHWISPVDPPSHPT